MSTGVGYRNSARPFALLFNTSDLSGHSHSCNNSMYPFANISALNDNTDFDEGSQTEEDLDENNGMQSLISDARGDEQPIAQAFEKKCKMSSEFMKTFLGKEKEIVESSQLTLDEKDTCSYGYKDVPFKQNEHSNTQRNDDKIKMKEGKEKREFEIYENVFINPEYKPARLTPRDARLNIESDSTSAGGSTFCSRRNTAVKSDSISNVIEYLNRGTTSSYNSRSPNVPIQHIDKDDVDAVYSSSEARTRNGQPDSPLSASLIQTIDKVNAQESKTRTGPFDPVTPTRLMRTLRLITENSDFAKGNDDADWTINDIMDEKLSTVNEEGDDFGMFDVLSSLTSGGKILVDQYGRQLKVVSKSGKFNLHVL